MWVVNVEKYIKSLFEINFENFQKKTNKHKMCIVYENLLRTIGIYNSQFLVKFVSNLDFSFIKYKLPLHENFKDEQESFFVWIFLYIINPFSNILLLNKMHKL